MEIHIAEEELDDAFMDFIKNHNDVTKDEKAKIIFVMEKILETLGITIDYFWE